MPKTPYLAVPLVALALLGAVLVTRTSPTAAGRPATRGTLVASRGTARTPATPTGRAGVAAKRATAAERAAKPRPAAIDGAAVLRAECTGCHGLATATRAHASQRGWLGIINGMSSMSSSKAKALASYLAAR